MSTLVDAAAVPKPPRATIDISLPAPVFHERQRLMRCGVHSINNLFQCRLYDKFSFDAICEQLTPDAWLNPHRSVLGVGSVRAPYPRPFPTVRRVGALHSHLSLSSVCLQLPATTTSMS